MRVLGLALALGSLLLVGAGCSGEQKLGETEKKTLRQNLNSPVDVEKIRAEYAKEKGKEGNKTGAADGM